MEEFANSTKWDVGRIAAEANVSSSAVSQWFGKGSKLIKSIGIGPATRLENATGFRAMWLSQGELPKRVIKDVDVSIGATVEKNLPSYVTSKDEGTPYAVTVKQIEPSLTVRLLALSKYFEELDDTGRAMVKAALAHLVDKPDSFANAAEIIESQLRRTNATSDRLGQQKFTSSAGDS